MRLSKWLGATCLAALMLAGSAEAAGPDAAPLPGGKYRGSVDGDRLTLKASRQIDTARNYGHGRIALRCAPGKTRLGRWSIDDRGAFELVRRNRRGGIILKAAGQFTDLDAVSGRIQRARGMKCERGSFSAELLKPAGVTKQVVRYGPYDTEPSQGHGHGGGAMDGGHMEKSAKAGEGHMDMGAEMEGGHMEGGTDVGSLIGHNVVRANVPKPCEDCYIVGMVPDLVDRQGNSLNFDDQAMLHHIAFADLTEPDATCGAAWPTGERFFAAGNERTPFALPRGYGYKIDAGDRWVTIAHLMNMAEHSRDLFVEMTYYTVDASSEMRDVEPFWLDVNNCGNSEYTIPAGKSRESRTFEVTPQWDGKVVAIGGHLHDDGKMIRATNATTGQTLCKSWAGYGSDPSYVGHIETVSGCTGMPGRLRTGDRLRLHSYYDSPTVQHDVMGIMVGYVAPGD